MEERVSVLKVLPLILGSLAFAIAGQLLLKLGMQRVTASLGQGAAAAATLTRAALQPYVLAGLVGYGASAALWILVLSKAPLSLVYPFAGLTFIGVFIVSWLFLGEAITPVRWIGMLIIVGGVTLAARG